MNNLIPIENKITIKKNNGYDIHFLLLKRAAPVKSEYPIQNKRADTRNTIENQAKGDNIKIILPSKRRISITFWWFFIFIEG